MEILAIVLLFVIIAHHVGLFDYEEADEEEALKTANRTLSAENRFIRISAYSSRLAATNEELPEESKSKLLAISELAESTNSGQIAEVVKLKCIALYRDLRAVEMPSFADWSKEFSYRYGFAVIGAQLILSTDTQFGEKERAGIQTELEAVLKLASNDIATKPSNADAANIVEGAILSLQAIADEVMGLSSKKLSQGDLVVAAV